MSGLQIAELKAVLRAYSAKDFWWGASRTLCTFGPRGIWQRHFGSWSRVVQGLLRQLDKYQNRVVLPFLQFTGETHAEFLQRLTAKLYFNNYLSEFEKKHLESSWTSDTPLQAPAGIEAQAYVLKGMLELLRKRPLYGPLAASDSIVLRTVEELLSFPFDVPLPRTTDDFYSQCYKLSRHLGKGWHNASNELLQRLFPGVVVDFDALRRVFDARARWMNPGTEEFHLAIAQEGGDLEYQSAVFRAACTYPSLATAFDTLKKRQTKETWEAIFVDKFPKYLEWTCYPAH